MKIAAPPTTILLCIIYYCATILSSLSLAQAQYRPRSSETQQRLFHAYRNYLQQYLYTRRINPPYYTTPRPTPRPTVRPVINDEAARTRTTTTTKKPQVLSPVVRLSKLIDRATGDCGNRSSDYLPHSKRKDLARKANGQLPRRGRIVWDDDDSQGAAAPPSGTFPWMVSLFVLLKNGEALFMCAGALLTPNIAVTAAHCFTNNEQKTTWFARVGDNYILQSDPEEQTFRVSKIVKHGNFKPLGSEDNGDGRNDIALIVLQPHRGGRDLYGNSNQGDGFVTFGKDVSPVCMLPQSDYPLHKLTDYHCEIAGWGMTEYNNSNSYPDSVRAARITVGDVSDTFCNF